MKQRHALGLLVAVLSCAGCGDENLRTADTYCGEVAAQLDALNNPIIASPADIDATLDRYRSLSKRAPLAVQPEWEQLVDAFEVVASVDASLPGSAQTAADTMRAADNAAQAIADYTATTCGLTLNFGA